MRETCVALVFVGFGTVGCDKLTNGGEGASASASAASTVAAPKEAASSAPPPAATTAAPAATTAAPTATAAAPTATAKATPTPTPTSAPSAKDEPAGACESIAGTWKTGGTCGPDTCIITQKDCATNFKCSDGAASYTGSVKGRSVSYSGVGVTGAKGSCKGTLSADNKSISGTCQSGGARCSFSAKKR